MTDRASTWPRRREAWACRSSRIAWTRSRGRSRSRAAPAGPPSRSPSRLEPATSPSRDETHRVLGRAAQKGTTPVRVDASIGPYGAGPLDSGRGVLPGGLEPVRAERRFGDVGGGTALGGAGRVLRFLVGGEQQHDHCIGLAKDLTGGVQPVDPGKIHV